MSGFVSGGVAGVAARPGWTGFSKPYGSTMAHELGHNMSLGHAPCSVEGDPFYPHSDGSIGVWGYDFRDNGSLVAPSTPDVMSYCTDPIWISDYYFSQALQYRLVDEDARAEAAAPTRSLLLWGGVGADSLPLLQPAFVVDAPAALPDSAGEYRITGGADGGQELFSFSFTMPETAHGGGSSSFVFILPSRPGWEGNLASLTLTGPGGSVTLDGDSDLPMAILRDPSTGQVRGFLRDPAASPQAAMHAAGPAGGPELEALFSRGIPDASAWRR
ncbi:MAG: M66 family metalloprotease [Gemmatimonadota bacterium]|nr:M66 family metalloprotease [Gemmatimonadota bacterium]